MPDQDQPRRNNERTPLDIARLNSQVISRLIEAQQALRHFATSASSGDDLADLDNVRVFMKAASNLEDAAWLALGDGHLTMREIADHNGTSRQAANQRIAEAGRHLARSDEDISSRPGAPGQSAGASLPARAPGAPEL